LKTWRIWSNFFSPYIYKFKFFWDSKKKRGILFRIFLKKTILYIMML